MVRVLRGSGPEGVDPVRCGARGGFGAPTLGAAPISGSRAPARVIPWEVVRSAGTATVAGQGARYRVAVPRGRSCTLGLDVFQRERLYTESWLEAVFVRRVGNEQIVGRTREP